MADDVVAQDRPRPGPRIGEPDIVSQFDRLGLLLGDSIALLETLERIAEYTAVTFPHVAGATVSVADRSVRAAAGLPAVRLADELHEAVGEGPALSALERGAVLSCGSLGGSEEWRKFGPRAGRLGLHSVLGIPLAIASAPIGAIVAYSARKDAFGAQDIATARRFAVPTAAIVRNAHVLEQSQRRVAQLSEALRVRPKIDRAIGIIMSRTGKSADDAMEALRRTSNARHIKVADLAAEIVEEAARRAQNRTLRDSRFDMDQVSSNNA